MNEKLLAVMLCIIACTFAFLSDYTDNEVLRLHVLANSNSAYDQSVKMKVKDRVSAVMAEKSVTSYENAVAVINDNEVSDIVNEVLNENGAEYGAKIDIEKCYFPERTYENLTFKKGTYNAVRIKLGKAQGENWWCVLFPPLCFIDSSFESTDIGQTEQVEFKSLLADVLK